MILKRHLKNCWALCMALLLFGNAAQAATPELSLEVPQKVARGDAFVARAVSVTPVDRVTFRWRGKEHVVPVTSEQTEQAGHTGQKGQAGQAGQTEQAIRGLYVAEMLLAVPVDDNKSASMILEARTAKAKATSSVALYSKDRPVQKLTVDRKYVDPPANEAERIKADREKMRAATAVFSMEKSLSLPLLRPVPGGVSSLYGLKRVFNGQPRSVHKGLDLRGAEGTPILAAADGVVVLADNLYFSGNAVYLDHGLGVFTAYLHMSQSHAQPGQRVRRGETIGLVGATGRVTGPHLHFTLLVQGVPVDPQPLMEVKP